MSINFSGFAYFAWKIPRMLIETDLHVRVAALEAKQKMVHMDEDSQFLGSVEGQEVESMLAPRPLSASSPCVLPSQNWNSSSIKSVDPAESAQIRRFFSEHTANSLVKQRASAASAASTQEMTSPSPIPPEHYRFVQSTFDLMMFVGTGHLGCLGAAQTVALVLFTIFMQALFFGFAMVNFLDPVVTDQTVSDALRWRRSSAHALSQYDPVVGLSLGERVCGGDKSLHLSGIQMSLFEEIKQYLRLDVQGIWAFFNGQTLCVSAEWKDMERYQKIMRSRNLSWIAMHRNDAKFWFTIHIVTYRGSWRVLSDWA